MKNTLIGMATLFTGLGGLMSCDQSPKKHVEVLGVAYKENKECCVSNKKDTLIFSIDTAFNKNGSHLPVNDTLLVLHKSIYEVDNEPTYFMAFCYDKEKTCVKPQLKAGRTVYQFRDSADYVSMKEYIANANLYHGFNRTDRFRIVQTPNVQ